MKAVAFLGIAAFAACHSAAKPGTGPTKGGAPGAVDDLALLPVDSELVVGVHFGQLKQSGAWQTHVAPMLAKADVGGLHVVRELCGFDPLEAIDTVALGLKGLDGEPSGAVVVHGLDRAKSMTCFDTNYGKAEQGGAKVTIAGDVALVTHNGKNAGFTFVDDKTALLVIGPEAATAEGIKAIARGTGTLRTSASFVELYDKINHDQSLWGIANGNAPAFQRLGLPFKMRAIFGSMNVTDGIAIDLRMRTPSPDEASNAASQLKPLVEGQMKAFVDTIGLTADGADLKLDVSVGRAKLAQLIMSMTGGGAGGEAQSPRGE